MRAMCQSISIAPRVTRVDLGLGLESEIKIARHHGATFSSGRRRGRPMKCVPAVAGESATETASRFVPCARGKRRNSSITSIAAIIVKIKKI